MNDGLSAAGAVAGLEIEHPAAAPPAKGSPVRFLNNETDPPIIAQLNFRSPSVIFIGL